MFYMATTMQSLCPGLPFALGGILPRKCLSVSREMGGSEEVEESDDWELWLPKCSFEDDKME